MTFEEGWKDCMDWTEYEPDPREKALAQAAWDAANKTNVWKRALDNELVLWGKLTPEEATFKEAIDTLRTLLLITQSVATDPLVNGGYVLVPVEPNQKMLDIMHDLHIFGETEEDIYKAMIQAAQDEG